MQFVLFDIDQLLKTQQKSTKKDIQSHLYMVVYTFPTPGTRIPSTGRGISTLITVPYLEHSSRTSSSIPVQYIYI